MPQSEIINIMILFIMAVGVIVLIISLIFMKDKSGSDYNLMIEQQIKIDEELKSRIDEADRMLQELNQFSSYIQEELEKKHKELLFLYQFIEEKEKNLTSIKTTKDNNSNTSNIKKKELDVQISTVLNNKHYKNIIELYKSGKDTSSIAKELNIGKGEVDLILSLSKITK